MFLEDLQAEQAEIDRMAERLKRADRTPRVEASETDAEDHDRWRARFDRAQRRRHRTRKRGG